MELSSREPRNRRCAHIVAAGDGSQRFTVLIAALDRFALLVGRQLRLAPELHTLRLCVGSSARGALLDAAALQFRGDAKHGKDKLGEVGSRIDDGLGERAQARARALHVARDNKQVGRVARQAVNRGRYHHVTGGESGHHLFELGPVGGHAADFLAEDMRASCRSKLRELRGEVLRVGRYAGVAVNHAFLCNRILQQKSPEKPRARRCCIYLDFCSGLAYGNGLGQTQSLPASIFGGSKMTFSVWSAFAAASFVMGLIPGPGVTAIVGYALGSGRKTALASVAGMTIGNAIAMTLSLAGVGALLAASALAFSVLKWAGALYLIGLGIYTISKSGQASSATDSANVITPRTAFLGNVAVGVFHPKTIVFYVSFVPQFISANDSYTLQAGVLTATFCLIVAATDSVYALAASSASSLLSRAKVATWSKRASGSVLICAGVATATTQS